MPTKVKDKTVYEYFRESSVVFAGKHVDYIDAMWKLNKINESYFRRLVDLYAVAAAIGIKTGRKAKEDNGAASDIKRTIQMDQLMENLGTLKELMRMALILDNSRGLNLEQKLDSAFRNPEDEETYKNNMELFNSYARGGIEYLYEHLVARPVGADDEDYGDARVTNIMSLLNSVGMNNPGIIV